MDSTEFKNNDRSNSKWIEGLVLLIILVLAILLGTFGTKFGYTTILDEQVSTWSGTIDNLD